LLEFTIRELYKALEEVDLLEFTARGKTGKS
jgi:hypothetical protein